MRIKLIKRLPLSLDLIMRALTLYLYLKSLATGTTELKMKTVVLLMKTIYLELPFVQMGLWFRALTRSKAIHLNTMSSGLRQRIHLQTVLDILQTLRPESRHHLKPQRRLRLRQLVKDLRPTRKELGNSLAYLQVR
jgi:hypothetical protein